MSFRKILVAVDESAFAARAADVGFDLARSLGAEVAIIHVVDPSVVAYAPEGGIPAGELVTLAQQDGKRLLRHSVSVRRCRRRLGHSFMSASRRPRS